MDSNATSNQAAPGGSDGLQQALAEVRNILKEAEERNIPEPNAVSLATADVEGRPSVRTIYLHSIHEKGPVFFVNLDSGKGQQIVSNPHVAICMFIHELQQQVTLEGKIEPLSEDLSDEYWSHRSRASQLAGWASNQQKTSEDREQLHKKRDDIKHEFDFEPVPRPANWRALLIHPTRVEFWDTGWHRLRQRRLFTLEAEGRWKVEIENP